MASPADRIAALLDQPWFGFLARLAVALPFLLSGLAKLADFAGAMAEVRALAGLEPAWLFAALVILTQLGGAALLLFGGRRAWLGAALLAGFTAVATLLAHAFWTKPAAERFLHQNIFFEHVSIIGGLLAAAILAQRASARAAA
ncbi:DoxX family protein [Siccirubricoccus phaeus]|uniref:DoxX family protein n=1 Tax=Siccirubricoccus phaeus TaxID=2595053 RepID=UPI0011F1BAAD|nr:DoxX family protein [Siccirubricoccus phaeus]